MKKKIKRFLEWLFLEVLKLWYKPTQFYYTNKIQKNNINKTNIGVGRVYLFSNRKEKLYDLQKELKLSDDFLYKIGGYPAIEIYGSKIGIIKKRSNYFSLPQNEIFNILKKQKSDRI